MGIPYYQVDAFTSSLFTGNLAGVCLLADWLSDSVLQSIAAENNLAETAFVVQRDSVFDLRWFAPLLEVDLCGHATLASAHVLEDPVTGSAHCTLIPYWAERLGRPTLRALQVSSRGGELFCEHRGERVGIGGRAVTYSSGFLHVS